MRAAYSSGVLAAFHDAGLRFDAIYGTSVGGALAAWWSAGQVEQGLRTWAYARDPRIMSVARFLTFRGPLLDHDALFRVVYGKEVPLDLHALEAAPWPIIVPVTEVATGEVRYVDLRKGRAIDWLRATGRLPLASGPAVRIDGADYIDGGFTDPIPVRKAIEDGHRAIVAILNEAKAPRKPEGRFSTWLVTRRYPALADLARRHHAIHDEAVDLVEHPPRGVDVHVVRPAKPTGLHRLSRNERKLAAAIEQGRADGHTFVATHPGLMRRTQAGRVGPTGTKR